MDIEALRATIRHLYEGEHMDMGVQLSDSIEFHDPLVIVKSRRRVTRMFRRLNWIFPKTRVTEFEALPNSINRYRLSVDYARSHRTRPTRFESVVVLHMQNGHIERIVEHWTHPLSRHGDGQSALSRLTRSSLGRILA